MSKNEELRSKSVEDLNKELLELRKAQFGLRMQLATQALTKPSEIERVRRQIARVHTFLTEKSKSTPKSKGSAK
jgi:large subunit ribosomal protein L29